MKNVWICLILAVVLMQFGALAEEPADASGSTLYLGMPPEAVEAVWGAAAGSDSYTGTLRWYTKDGHTLICGYSWCDVQRGVWHNVREGDDVWGLAEWVEFNSHRKRVSGTIPKSETVWKAAWQIARWNEMDFNRLSRDEQSAARIHVIGSGAAYAAQITGDGWIVEQAQFPVPIPCLGQGADAILVPVFLMILQAGLFLFAVYSLIRALAEAKEFRRTGRKQTLWLGPWPGLFVIVLSAAGVIASFAMVNGWALCWLDIPFLCMACAALNMRIDWSTEGFAYRTAMRCHVWYAYSDIRQARLIGDGRAGQDLMLKMRRRRVLLDYAMGLPAFLSEYNNWRSRNGLLSVKAEQERQWKENYMRHGPFARKLDRISGGRMWLALSLVFGALLVGSGLWVAALSSGAAFAGGIIMLLVGIAFPLLQIYAVAHMNRKMLRWFYRGRIRPDPEVPPKQKRYKRKA